MLWLPWGNSGTLGAGASVWPIGMFRRLTLSFNRYLYSGKCSGIRTDAAVVRFVVRARQLWQSKP